MSLLVYETPCKNCLFSDNKIVSDQRKEEILKTCTEEQTHFTCHKATMQGKDVCCNRFYHTQGHVSKKIQLLNWLNAVQFVPVPEGGILITYKEMNQ